MESPTRRNTHSRPGTPVEPAVSLSGRALPAGRIAARRVYVLPLEKLRPVIRIAHQQTGALHIPERLILDHELVLILKGRGRLQFGSEPVPFQAGSLLFIPPFAPHHFASEPGETDHVAIHFDLAAHFPPFAADLRRRPPYEVRPTHGLALPSCSVVRAGEPVHRWLLEIVAHFARGHPSARLRAEALLLNVLATLYDAPAAAPPQAINQASRQRLERALGHLERHLAEHLVPADLARAAGLSPSHFTRLFRLWTGLPPGEYLLRRRVEQACKLLGDSTLSIKEVAARSGFDDPYYFSKVFRRIDGLTPTLFREALLAGRRVG